MGEEALLVSARCSVWNASASGSVAAGNAEVVRAAKPSAAVGGSQRGRNSHQIGVLGIYDLQGLSYGRTELLVADMRLLEPDPSGSPPVGRC